MFESLPDELYLLVFRYLHKFDIIYSFANLNQRFQQIIEPYLYEINLSGSVGAIVSYKYFQLFVKYILPLNGQNIRSLTLSNNQQCHLIEPHIHRFINLESLHISCKIKPENTFLQTTLSSLPSLSYKLSISSETESNLLKSISLHARPNLNNIIWCCWNGLKSLDNDILPMPFIKYFSINIQSIEILVKLFEIMPNIEELCLSIIKFNGLENIPSILNIPLTLKALRIEIGSYDYYHRQNPFNSRLNQIKQFVNLFKTQIQFLTLIAMNVDDKDFSNFDNFQNLIQDFTHLEKFEYYFNTIHQPDAHFSNFEQLPDSTYSIYTLPKPLSFNKQSERIKFNFDLHSNLSLQEFWNCETLHIDSNARKPPTKFELKNISKLVNLRNIVLEDPIVDIYDAYPETHEYLKQIINIAPNLITLNIRIAWEGTRSVVHRLQEMFVHNSGKQIKYFHLPIITANDRKGYPFPELFSHLSSIFPNLTELDVYVEQKELNECYKSIIELMKEMREKFSKLIHLTLGMWLRDESDRIGFETYKSNLNELSDSLYYSAIHSHDCYYNLKIWL